MEDFIAIFYGESNTTKAYSTIQYYRLLSYPVYYFLYPPHPLVLELGPQ